MGKTNSCVIMANQNGSAARYAHETKMHDSPSEPAVTFNEDAKRGKSRRRPSIPNGQTYAQAQDVAIERMNVHYRHRAACARIIPSRRIRPATKDILPMDAASGEWEAYKFDGEESGVHLERRSKLSRSHHNKIHLASILIVFAIGAISAVLAASMAIGAHFFHSSITSSVSDLVVKKELGEGFGIYIAANLALITVAALLVRFAPAAAASGLPLIKANLNGCHLHRAWAGPSTLLAKSVGITLVVATGLPLGKEGPFVHIGAMIGYILSSTVLPGTASLLELRMPKHQREWVGLGAAAGVTAAFNAPLGGILYAFEEVCSAWSNMLTWRCVICSVIVSAFSSLLADVSSGWLHYESFVIGLSSDDPSQRLPVTKSEIFPLLLIAVVCGGLGGAFNQIVVALCHRRAKIFRLRPNLRVCEALLLTFMALSIYFWLPLAFGCTKCPDSLSATDHNADSSTATRRLSQDASCQVHVHLPLLQWHCNDGYYSELGTLLHAGQEGLIKQLFARTELSAFSPASLAVLFVLYFCLAAVLMGLALPAGNFVPGIVIGASFGRVVGIFMARAGVCSERSEGTFAISGAAAMLGGMTHMTITVAVILVEITYDGNMLPTIMLMLAVAKSVSLIFSHSFDDCMMHALGLPFLEEDPPIALDMLCARDVMESQVVSFHEVERVCRITETLKSTTHNGFPIITPKGHVAGLILRRQILVLLRDHVWEGRHRVTDQVKERFVGSYALDSLVGGSWVAELEHDSASIDLRSFMDPCPLSPGYLTPLNRIHRLFNEFGMRHLPIIDREACLCGIITRKDLLPDAVKSKVLATRESHIPSLKDLLNSAMNASSRALRIPASLSLSPSPTSGSPFPVRYGESKAAQQNGSPNSSGQSLYSPKLTHRVASFRNALQTNCELLKCASSDQSQPNGTSSSAAVNSANRVFFKLHGETRLARNELHDGAGSNTGSSPTFSQVSTPQDNTVRCVDLLSDEDESKCSDHQRSAKEP